MAIGWFLVPVQRRLFWDRPCVYIGMDDYTETIRADANGHWAGIYVGPSQNRALCKVRASSATLTAIAAGPGVTRIPVALLDSSLGSLTAGQRAAISAEMQAMGYTPAEISANLPNLASVTLRQLLHFVRSKRNGLRYDPVGDVFVADGPVEAGETVDELNGLVT